MSADAVVFVDATGKAVAQVAVLDQGEGWFTGTLLSEDFATEARQALAWYDEVLRHQMLSYLDEATAAVERLGLRLRDADGAVHPLYSLHINDAKEVAFRTTPVPPPGR